MLSCETNIIKKLSLKSSSWVYVTYLWIKADFYSDSEIAVTGTCAGDQKVLICTRQRPVGREERINFTLERRSKRHLRICRGISLFPLLSSQGSIKKKIYLLEWLWAVCVCVTKHSTFPPKNSRGQTEISHLAFTTSKDKSAILRSLPAVCQQSVTTGLTGFDLCLHLIDAFTPHPSSSLEFGVYMGC